MQALYRVRFWAVFIGFQVIWGVAHSLAHPADGRDQRRFRQSSFWGGHADRVRIVLGDFGRAVECLCADQQSLVGSVVTAAHACHVPKIVKGFR